MAMYLCGGGDKLNTISLWKKFLYPLWKSKTPLSTPVPDFNGFIGNNNISSSNGYFLPLLGLCGMDLHKYLLPSNFNGNYVVGLINNGILTVMFTESPLTIDNDSDLILPPREIYSIGDYNDIISFITTTNDIVTSSRTSSGFVTLNKITSDSPVTILFSSYDIVNSNVGYHFYKNIELSDIKTGVQI